MPAVTKAMMDAAWRAERKIWLATHPGRPSVEYTKLKNAIDVSSPAAWENSELIKWRRARAKRQDKAMRKAWLHEHPGEGPLPEHLCALENPFPGHKRWCARALRWIAEYDKRPRK